MGASNISAPLARQPCSWEESTEKVLYARCSFIDKKSSKVCLSGSSACPKKAARMEQFVLGDIAAGEGGMWLQEGEQVALQPWGAAWACILTCAQATLCCASCNYAESFKVVEINVLK